MDGEIITNNRPWMSLNSISKPFNEYMLLYNGVVNFLHTPVTPGTVRIYLRVEKSTPIVFEDDEHGNLICIDEGLLIGSSEKRVY